MTGEENTPAPRGWLWPAVVMAALTALVPSVAYIELGRTLSGGFVGLPKHFAELIGACSALFLSLLILRHYNKKEELGLDLKELFALKPYGRTGLVFAAAGLAGAALLPAYLWVMLTYYRDYDGGSGVIVKLWEGNDKWFFVIAATFIYACCEEIFLRGMVFTYIRKHAGVVKALLVSSLLFSLLHGGRLWVALLFIFLDGVLYALVFEKTRSLAVPTLLHGLHNSALRVFGLLGLFD